jgi:D-apiose dehydrogenase
MSKLRFALFGAGFWSQYQLAGWYEVGGVECVAIYNRTASKAEGLATRFKVPKIYDDAENLIANETLDFIDVCTNVETHAQFVELAARHKIPVICQKPIATTLGEAEQMVKTCHDAGIPLLINENWRWQYPLRRFKDHLDSGRIGKIFRGRIHYANSFPVFDNQPFLKDLEQFILTDIGSHILDVARFLFGDAKSLYATTHRVHPDIKGEDVATTMMKMGGDITVVCEMSYVYVEGDKGFLELGPDYWIRETTEAGTLSKRYPPPRYDWANPAYDLIHSSIVPCQADLLAHLKGEKIAETNGDDNLKTAKLYFGSYESAKTGQALGREKL